VTIANTPEMKEQFERNGAEAITMTPADLSQLIKAEIDKYTKVIRAAGIKIE